MRSSWEFPDTHGSIVPMPDFCRRFGLNERIDSTPRFSGRVEASPPLRHTSPILQLTIPQIVSRLEFREGQGSVVVAAFTHTGDLFKLCDLGSSGQGFLAIQSMSGWSKALGFREPIRNGPGPPSPAPLHRRYQYLAKTGAALPQLNR